MKTIYKILKKNPFILFPFIREYNIILQNMINLIFKIELITSQYIVNNIRKIITTKIRI